MSRVGKAPISIPDKTKITYKDRIITVQGEKGSDRPGTDRCGPKDGGSGHQDVRYCSSRPRRTRAF